jgi:hypothetical protein
MAEAKIADLEPGTISVQPNYNVGGITLEIVDSAGAGFLTVLDQAAALNLALRLIAAIARLRGWESLP